MTVEPIDGYAVIFAIDLAKRRYLLYNNTVKLPCGEICPDIIEDE